MQMTGFVKYFINFPNLLLHTKLVKWSWKRNSLRLTSENNDDYRYVQTHEHLCTISDIMIVSLNTPSGICAHNIDILNTNQETQCINFSSIQFIGVNATWSQDPYCKTTFLVSLLLGSSFQILEHHKVLFLTYLITKSALVFSFTSARLAL